jgi:hypothetical protein
LLLLFLKRLGRIDRFAAVEALANHERIRQR